MLTLPEPKPKGDPLGGLGCRMGSGCGSQLGDLCKFIFGTFQLGKEKIYIKPPSLDFKQKGCAVLGVSRIFTVLRQDDRCPLQIINKG